MLAKIELEKRRLAQRCAAERYEFLDQLDRLDHSLYRVERTCVTAVDIFQKVKWLWPAISALVLWKGGKGISRFRLIPTATFLWKLISRGVLVWKGLRSAKLLKN